MIMTVSSKRRPANGILTKRCPRGIFTTSHPRCWGEAFQRQMFVVYLRSTPHPVTVTNEGLQGFPTKNGITLVVTVIGWGVDLTYILQTSPSNLHFTSVCVPPASPRWRWWTSVRTPPCEKTWPRCCQRRTILVVALQTAGVVIINAAEGFHTQKDTFFWYCIFSTRLERYN